MFEQVSEMTTSLFLNNHSRWSRFKEAEEPSKSPGREAAGQVGLGASPGPQSGSTRSRPQGSLLQVHAEDNGKCLIVQSTGLNCKTIK